MIKFDVYLTQYKQDVFVQQSQLNTVSISDYITELQYTYMLRAPYEQATIRAKMPFNDLFLQMGRVVQPSNQALLEYDTMHVDGWATIYEIDDEQNTRKLRFFGVVSSISSGIVADQNGLKTTIDLNITLNCWLSVLQTPIKLILSEYYNTQNLKVDSGASSELAYYQKLDSLLKNFQDPKDAIKQWFTLFATFRPGAEITDKALKDAIFLTRTEELKKYGITGRTLTEIISFNFDTLFPALNNSLLSSLTSSFQGEMDSVLEFFPSYEQVTANEGIFSNSTETGPPETKVQPVLIYRYRPLPIDYINSVAASSVVFNPGEIKGETRQTGENEFEVVFERTGASLTFNSIKPKVLRPIKIDTVSNLSISWNANNRLNLINVSTRASGVNNILGTTTDFFIDEASIKKYGVFSYEATYPFFGATDKNEKIRDFAKELTTYVQLILGSGETYGNAQCTSYYEPNIKHGEYVCIGVAYPQGNSPFPTSYYIGYCTQVTHHHRALADGRVQRSTSFTLERLQVYQEG